MTTLVMFMMFFASHSSQARDSNVVGKNSHQSMHLADDRQLPKPEANTLLWQVEKPGVKTSYLLGSLHIGSPGNSLLPWVYTVASDVKQVVFESNINDVLNQGQVALSMAQKMKGSGKEALGDERFSRVAIFFNAQTKGATEQLAALKPWVLWVGMERSFFPMGISENEGIDRKVMAWATDHHKSLVYLEPTLASLDYMDELPLAYIQQSIDVGLAIPKRERQAEYAQMYQYYQQNNPEKVIDLTNAINQQNQALLTPKMQEIGDNWMKNRLLTARNHQWQKPLLHALAQDSSLVVVGAAHLFGREGLIALLRQSGYTVTPLFNQTNIKKEIT